MRANRRRDAPPRTTEQEELHRRLRERIAHMREARAPGNRPPPPRTERRQHTFDAMMNDLARAPGAPSRAREPSSRAPAPTSVPRSDADDLFATVARGTPTHDDTARLNRLMLDERHYRRFAADPTLFPQVYTRIRPPARDPGYRFSPDPETHARRSRQEILSTEDQLHYIAWRTGAGRSPHAPPGTRPDGNRKGLAPGPGLANRTGIVGEGGVEENLPLDADTAREVQFDALTRLIMLHAGHEVRMPGYSHRVGPMRAPQNLTDDYDDRAAGTLNAILGSTDEGGANIRVTDADRGPGAYVSTDGDNFYGPHGITLDPRDLHQHLLSSSADNRREHSSERTSDMGHQFRALSRPIMLTGNGRPTHSDVFVGTTRHQGGALARTLQSRDFTHGILQDRTSEALRSVFRTVHRRTAPEGSSQGRRPPVVVDPATHEQPKDQRHADMMQQLVQEANGLYEPHAWSETWRNDLGNRPMSGMARQVEERFAMQQPEEKKDGSFPEFTEDEWEDGN